jgi:hypothetical protein
MVASRLQFHTLQEWATCGPAGLPDLSEWVHGYLCQPHTDVGRTGAVCPYVPKAVKRRLLDVALVPDDICTLDDVVDLVCGEAAAFVERHGWDTRHEPAWIMLFAHFTYSDCHDLLLPAHRAAKPTLVSRGLMLGEFFPGYDLQGLRNRRFRAGEAPLPMLVIRRMVRQDGDFLVEGPSDLYRQYQQRFGERVG